MHTGGSARTGMFVLDLFGKEGGDLSGVVVGHAGDVDPGVDLALWPHL
ncbi:hypothetical protein [Nonomuraea sp. NPDC046570]